ncbi:hypothetical protein DPMN_156723 [Dreissena polymorpha]|uniref:Uncharacterized protein n=1 Tax=Dreissena polymorpha TaxID=45954 RepID=A0A9D4FUT5_DREPO|nr:hypothetical protein DPMN_156723 [Dreissena polymorpha]
MRYAIIVAFAHLRGFHDDWANNVISRVHVILLTGTIYELNFHIKETNVLNKFHENWAKNVTSRKNALPTGGHENCPATGGHVFQRTRTTFELDHHIIKANILTNFKLGRYFIGAKLLTNKCLRTDGRTDIRRTKTGQKSSPEQSVFKLEIKIGQY